MTLSVSASLCVMAICYFHSVSDLQPASPCRKIHRLFLCMAPEVGDRWAKMQVQYHDLVWKFMLLKLPARCTLKLLAYETTARGLIKQLVRYRGAAWLERYNHRVTMVGYQRFRSGLLAGSRKVDRDILKAHRCSQNQSLCLNVPLRMLWRNPCVGGRKA